MPVNKFSGSIRPLNNIPSAPRDGTTDSLYSRHSLCSRSIVQQSIPILLYTNNLKSTKIPRIALIKKQSRYYSLVGKIKNAKVKGAIDAIVYDTISNQDVGKAVFLKYLVCPYCTSPYALSLSKQFL
jgi:hypothetical protein